MQNKKWAFWLEIAEKMIRELTKMDVYSDKWFDKQRERSEEKRQREGLCKVAILKCKVCSKSF